MEPEKIDADVRAGFAALNARAAELETGTAPGQPGRTADTQPTVDEWRIVVKGLLKAAPQFAPNWTFDTKAATDIDALEVIEDAATKILNDLLPGGLGNIDEWGPWGKLAFGCGCLALVNFDWARLRLKPLHREPIEHEKEEQTDAAE